MDVVVHENPHELGDIDLRDDDNFAEIIQLKDMIDKKKSSELQSALDYVSDHSCPSEDLCGGESISDCPPTPPEK